MKKKISFKFRLLFFAVKHNVNNKTMQLTLKETIMYVKKKKFVGMLNRTRVIIMNSFYANLKHIIVMLYATWCLASKFMLINESHLVYEYIMCHVWQTLLRIICFSFFWKRVSWKFRIYFKKISPFNFIRAQRRRSDSPLIRMMCLIPIYSSQTVLSYCVHDTQSWGISWWTI